MTPSDIQEQMLRIAWLEKQMTKADADMDLAKRRDRRETIQIIISVVALVVAAFAAGHFIR